ncbi:HAD-IA family hydrolase [Tamlana agarivorans]|uniref:HAD-IA family hydrolase n=1 Tax=Pseudotamlana agarivorans TaxID=481183 RepID=A0ACC5UCD1_9FLAO|nr:HAD-IA family hydrolase [Tamlana agarivorans]MBU2951996.1 HAD-IA family hydrolase [Tamlana agarivorans]
MYTSVISYLEKNENISTVFIDYFDTIIHTKVHTDNIIRIWAKIMIRETGLNLSINELFLIRKECSSYLADVLKVDHHKVPYESLVEEVVNRMMCSGYLEPIKVKLFKNNFEPAIIKAEQNVQYLNADVVETLEVLKQRGIKIYLVSDYFASIEVLINLLKHHRIFNYFDEVFTSSSQQLSKRSGDIYPSILKKLSLKGSNVLMIGDNIISDFKNSKSNGLHAILLPHKKYLKKNKINNFGNDNKDYKKLISTYHAKCKDKKAEPLSEYILIYGIFIERLYAKCKRDNIKNLFFLSREGKFLKKLFDRYQEYHALEKSNLINTHYLRISRQASFQFSFKPINEEEFKYLKVKFPNISVEIFLNHFDFPEKNKTKIKALLNCDCEVVIESFFESSMYKELLKNPIFIETYDNYRLTQRKAFQEYIYSFGVDFEKQGLHLVDIGWRGTMQDSIYNFFDESINMTGYYLGFKKGYNVSLNNKNNKLGLVFSIYPVKKYSDFILDVNSQIYEQLLGANHGSAVSYSLIAPNYTNESFEPVEKALYSNYIKKTQNFKFNIFKSLIEDLEKVCYDEQIVNKYLPTLMMKIGFFPNSKELIFMNVLNKSLYNNIGKHNIGVEYSPKDVGSFRGVTKTFLLRPEKTFRYFTKLKLMLYNKNKMFAFLFPMSLIFYYFKINKFLKTYFLNRSFYFKYLKIN